MTRISKAAFSSYHQELPDDLKALRMFFRAATEYHQVHNSQVPATVQARRWARSEIEARVFIGMGPDPVTRRYARILAADRAARLARIRERRRARAAEVLRLDLNVRGGEVVTFERRRPAERAAASA